MEKRKTLLDDVQKDTTTSFDKIINFEDHISYKTFQKKELEEERAEAIKNAKILSLPELKGSKKQIAWALTIRDNFLNNFERHFKNRKILASKLEIAEDYIKMINADADIIKNFFINKTDSSFWIDNRVCCVYTDTEFLIEYRTDSIIEFNKTIGFKFGISMFNDKGISCIISKYISDIKDTEKGKNLHTYDKYENIFNKIDKSTIYRESIIQFLYI